VVSYAAEGQLLLGNYSPADTAALQPYEARLYLL
jgi:hypothetical protein